MKEIKGELWDYQGPPYVICITTNGFVKKNGEAVMGRGCAKEASRKIKILPRILGTRIAAYGNIVQDLTSTDPDGLVVTMISFPVKHNWWEPADLELIKQSVKSLKDWAEGSGDRIFILPRPGCGNGHRTWDEVRPLLVDLPDNVWVISK